MKLILYIYRLITGFMARLKEDHVGAYASQAALFMIMALFPMLILILNILRYTPCYQTVSDRNGYDSYSVYL